MKRVLIDAQHESETRVVLLDEKGNLEQFDYEVESKELIRGNIYLAKIAEVSPALQAAFVDYGGNRHGFLPFSEIHPDYYNLPESDKKIKELQIKEIAVNEASEEKEEGGEKDLDFDQMEKDEIEQLLSSSEIQGQEEDDNSVEDNIGNAAQGNYNIQEVIKKNQIILLQAQKEERGNKGAVFTTYISLAGTCCILSPNKANKNGISRRISDPKERSRLKSIVNDIIQDSTSAPSLIIRTSGVKKSHAQISRSYNNLVTLWNKIREDALKAKAPSLVYMEDTIIQRAVRDLLDDSVKDCIIQGELAYKSAVTSVKNIFPEQAKKISRYKNKVPIFSKFNVEQKISKLYEPIVSLSSGGYIVINPTEALTAIDVNSGRSNSAGKIEDTAFKTNVEAAKEIARQIRLRNISGLIVIDFIDMGDLNNKKLVQKVLARYCSSDKAKLHIGHITSFGLVEMSRQRKSSSFLEHYSNICTNCDGKGVIKNDYSNAMLIIRTIHSEIDSKNIQSISIYANHKVIEYIFNYKRHEIDNIERKYNISLKFISNTENNIEGFSLEKVIRQDSHSSSGNEKEEEIAEEGEEKSQSTYERKKKENVEDKESKSKHVYEKRERGSARSNQSNIENSNNNSKPHRKKIAK